jgi:hypothetical protein
VDDIARRELGGWEVAMSILAGLLLAVAMHWPIPAHLGSEVPGDLGDPLVQAWQVAWGGHALLSQPLDYFQANVYWPQRNSLAFSDALVGYAPAGFVGRGPEAAVARYNLLFLLAYALAFVGPYLLARELGVGRISGTVAGTAFAYAPWRLDQVGHLHVLSSGGIALSLFLLVRGYRGSSPAMVLAGWLVATWQFLLGFTLGLQLAYLLAVLGLLAGVTWRKRRWRLPPGVLAATAAGIAVFVSAAVLLSRPYLQVLEDHPEARRSERDVALFSPALRSYLAAPASDLVWGSATARFRAPLAFPQEKTLFPGAAAVGLAVVGTLSGVYSRRLRIGLAAGAVTCAVFALGITVRGRPPFEPYRILYEYAPGWEGIQTPGRMNTLTSLALALLAAAGAHELTSRLRRRQERRDGWAARVTAVAGVSLVGVILAEGAGFGIDRPGQDRISAPPHATVPRQPRGQRSAPPPQVHLPLGVPHRYVLWSTDGFPPIVNGMGSFNPRWTRRLEISIRGFPDRASVARLRALGVRTVILHPELASGTPWESAASKSVRGLPLRREPRDGVILYRLRAR